MHPIDKSMAEQEPKDPYWLEISANVMCWFGIVGLIVLITQVASADPSGGKSGFLPGARPFGASQVGQPRDNPRANPAKGSFFDDEDEDDDFNNFDEPASAPNINSGRASGFTASPRSFSAGGEANSGPDPILTSKGISVGGTAANGIVSNSKLPPIHIDNETAEGSKDIVTDFNFPDADILDIAKTLGKLTGKNFILDKDVKGRITIISNSPITVGEAWKVFLTALDVNGFALIPSGKYLRIARQRDARDKQLKTYTGDFSPDTDALITRVFRLNYISAEEVARTFRSFMPANARIIPYEQTNTVIVTDTGSNISKLSKMLEILDVEGYDAGIEVVPVKYASAAELSKLIDALIPGTSAPGSGGGGGSPGGMPRFGGGGAGKFGARRTKEGGIINTIIPDERTNTLIIHANTRGADQVRELVTKLDQKLPAATGGGKVHVIYLQFADSEQLANTLNNFSSQSGPAGGRPAGGGGSSGTGTNPISASLFEGTIKISPDKATNALVVTASPSDFVTVQRVINRLDIPRDQVFVEVVVMEVQIGNNFSFSSNILSIPSLIGAVTSKEDLASIIGGTPGVPALAGATGAVIGFPLGKPTNVTINGQTTEISSVQGLIKAIQGNTNANILATPQIIALDNSEANFESAEKIPLLTSTAIQGAGVSTSITKESVALSIKIKPQINKMSNFIKLDVTTKYGDISNRSLPSAVQGQAFATLDRTAQTTVVVGDSDTIVLGGLIRDKQSEVVTKIPILGDIPLLGWLFKSKVTSLDKSNLLIFMTPHIIRQYEKVRAILDRKLKERDDFIETNAGGEDLLRPQRDAIIRSLPDIKELTQKTPVTTVTIDEERPAAVPVGPDSSPAGSRTESGPGANGVDPGQLNPEDRAPEPTNPIPGPFIPPPSPPYPPSGGDVLNAPPPTVDQN